MEETTQQMIQVSASIDSPELFLVLGFISALLVFILFSFYFNR